MSALAHATVADFAPHALTPHRVLAAALAYIASSAADIQDAQRAQLLTVLDGDEASLDEALAYSRHVAFEQFLKDAPSLLSSQEKLCVLVNVCDVLLADPKTQPAALVLFQRMLMAFGLSAEAFAPYYKTLILKNDRAVLGAYDEKAALDGKLTAHLALAISILYTMAANGSMTADNMGHLQTLIGAYEGLQGMALSYIRRVKFNQFLPQAALELTEPQKIYILIQACDSVLLSDHVEDLARQMFPAMLSAFGLSERLIRPYFHTIEIKNTKPIHDTAVTSAKGAKKSKVFETRSVHVGDKTKALLGAQSLAGGDAGPVLNRSMHDNLQGLPSESHADGNLALIPPSAGAGANVQKIAHDQAALNRQTLDDKGAVLNRQSIHTEKSVMNRQALASRAQSANPQLLGPNETLGDNLQPVGVDRLEDHRALVPVEDRLKELDVMIDQLQRKIDQFERKSKTVLREASLAKLTHPPQVADEMAQTSGSQNTHAAATPHLQIEKVAQHVLDLQNETSDWNAVWISSTVAIVSLTFTMSLRILWG
jgi:hypothetical protein